jgi:uncharacterized protein YuzE
MKLNYDAETDSLYIDLAERPGADSREISDGVVLDFDSQGELVGIDIEHASRRVALDRFVLEGLPGAVERIAG